MQVTIVITSRKGKKKRVSLQLPVIVGRAREAGISLPYPGVSRQHCEIFEAGGLVRVRDLGSTNGTSVAGKKVSEALLLPHDQFSIGPFTFEIDYRRHGDATAAEEGLHVASGGAPASEPDVYPLASETPEDWEAFDDVPGPAVEPVTPEREGPPRSRARPRIAPAADSEADASPEGAPGSRPVGRNREFSEWPGGAAEDLPELGASPPGTNRPRKRPERTAATSASDPNADPYLDELLQGLEDLNLEEFLKGLL